MCPLARAYEKIPIVDTARRCGLVLDPSTLRRREVEASCPFCGDHGKGKYHLSLNVDTDQYRCNLCGVSGNSVSLYARLYGLTNKEAYMELSRGGNVYPMPQQPSSQNTEPQPKPLAQRHEVYTDMLSLLTLSAEHRENLRERGLSDDRIDQNQYRSMPQTSEGRKLLAALLRDTGHDLQGIPGFRTSYGEWTLSGPNGFLIPARDITEGPLKGDVASYLDNDALFVCIGGVFALHGLKDMLISLGVTEVVEAMDMDQMTNPQVRRAIQSIRQEVQSIRGIRYSKYVWNPAYKGIDDYYLSRIAAQ